MITDGAYETRMCFIEALVVITANKLPAASTRLKFMLWQTGTTQGITNAGRIGHFRFVLFALS